jgi:hypothetical protein
MVVQMSLFAFLVLITAALFWKKKLKVGTALWVMLVMSAAPVVMTGAIQNGTGEVVAWLFQLAASMFPGA